jgi:hypothetical protein
MAGITRIVLAGLGWSGSLARRVTTGENQKYKRYERYKGVAHSSILAALKPAFKRWVKVTTQSVRKEISAKRPSRSSAGLLPNH